MKRALSCVIFGMISIILFFIPIFVALIETFKQPKTFKECLHKQWELWFKYTLDEYV